MSRVLGYAALAQNRQLREFKSRSSLRLGVQHLSLINNMLEPISTTPTLAKEEDTVSSSTSGNDVEASLRNKGEEEEDGQDNDQLSALQAIAVQKRQTARQLRRMKEREENIQIMLNFFKRTLPLQDKMIGSTTGPSMLSLRLLRRSKQFFGEHMGRDARDGHELVEFKKEDLVLKERLIGLGGEMDGRGSLEVDEDTEDDAVTETTSTNEADSTAKF